MSEGMMRIGSSAVTPGFASAMKQYEREQKAAAAAPPTAKIAEAAKTNLLLTPIGGIDKEHAGKPEPAVFVRQLLTLMAGRKVDLAKKGNQWRGYQEKLSAANWKIARVVAPRELIVKYVTDDEMATMVDGRIADRATSRSKENELLRKIQSQVNARTESKQRGDLKREKELLAASPDLHRVALERSQDPDNPKWFDPEEMSGVEVPPREAISLWLPAQFQAIQLGSSAINKLSIELEDRSGVLAEGRKDFLDMMQSDFGFDTSAVSTDWTPQFDVLETIGGRPIDGMRFNVPGWPLIVPLKPPHLYEV